MALPCYNDLLGKWQNNGFHNEIIWIHTNAVSFYNKHLHFHNSNFKFQYSSFRFHKSCFEFQDSSFKFTRISRFTGFGKVPSNMFSFVTVNSRCLKRWAVVYGSARDLDGIPDLLTGGLGGGRTGKTCSYRHIAPRPHRRAILNYTKHHPAAQILSWGQDWKYFRSENISSSRLWHKKHSKKYQAIFSLSPWGIRNQQNLSSENTGFALFPNGFEGFNGIRVPKSMDSLCFPMISMIFIDFWGPLATK